MGESRAAVILERTQNWIGVDLVAGAGEETAAIVITNIVAVRDNGASVNSDVSARGTGFEDSVPDLEWPCGEDTAAGVTCVAGDRAMTDDPATVDPTTTTEPINAVPADGAV